ncbi:hypothetical protein KR054_006159 [Drosophila jambulina]|nr:hypothetical protein KR054_006159 [Drosophila jambulina]
MCCIRVPEDLILTQVTRPVIRDKHQQFAFKDYVKSHPELRFCPGPSVGASALALALIGHCSAPSVPTGRGEQTPKPKRS